MNRWQNELETRMAFLSALARSQNALARILESMAEAGECSPHTSKLLQDNVSTLTAMQESIAETVTGLAWRRRNVRKGRPVQPWLQPKLSIQSFASFGGEASVEQ
ncbi:hypothetical protein [Paenibacillus sinopodophylli]|uniref:hypothetical protein n=1 Tax=Paenibacillus sinopodophylli TaxID=1837342 RepID=UPI00110D14E3|nr:hypothetical protein [Paenibacillus sinopodophylli]